MAKCNIHRKMAPQPPLLEPFPSSTCCGSVSKFSLTHSAARERGASCCSLLPSWKWWAGCWLLRSFIFHVISLPPYNATMASRPNSLPSLRYPKPRLSGDERLPLHQKDDRRTVLSLFSSSNDCRSCDNSQLSLTSWLWYVSCYFVNISSASSFHQTLH